MNIGFARFKMLKRVCCFAHFCYFCTDSEEQLCRCCWVLLNLDGVVDGDCVTMLNGYFTIFCKTV